MPDELTNAQNDVIKKANFIKANTLTCASFFSYAKEVILKSLCTNT